MPAIELLRSLLNAALAAAAPEGCLPTHLPAPPRGRTVVVGAGKAAAAMAQTVEAHWPATQSICGLVVTPYGHTLPAGEHGRRIEVIEAAHPLPDAAGVVAAQRMLAMVAGLSENDLVLTLLSGGGSALLVAPRPGLTLADKRAITQSLLRSGASIAEINCVRRHLSAIKGGRLALAAAPARVLTLAISDVPGDDLATIASGPTVPDPSTLADAQTICARYSIAFPQVGAGETAIAESPLPSETAIAESPLPTETAIWRATDHARCSARVIATAQSSLSAAAEVARAAGITPLVLGDRIEGEAREVAKALAGIALSCFHAGTPLPRPCVLLSGGETSVTLRDQSGRGGRNTEFLLALAIALDGHPGIYALAADTDGIDGSEDNAGAVITPDSLKRLRAAGLDARQLLDNNDAYRAFLATDDLIVTGPTRTNVNDFRAILLL
ncbi:MAG: glycerate kinase [Rhodocyclaceae bacterium]|nr:glycerate kinase [Rhodocyclaceae bacterium]